MVLIFLRCIPQVVAGEKSHTTELVLEGGAAFGTGDHATTRMCVHWLSRIYSDHKKGYTESNNVENKAETWSLLDYGCGSAILALGE